MNRPDLARLKENVDLRALVDTNREGKTLCPFHEDHHPSCHIYKDGFKCYSCGAHGDVLSWLQHTRGLDFAGAVRELEQLAGTTSLCKRTVTPTGKEPRPSPENRQRDAFVPIRDVELRRHLELVAELTRIPHGLQRRGFDVRELRTLLVADTPRGAAFAITGPTGAVLALKIRLRRLWRQQRYVYATPGHGSPAWCSPSFQQPGAVLVIEGELNGMAAWLARPDVAVMGVAGANGRLHTEALSGRTVYIYADGDEPGRQATRAWAEASIDAGARRVLLLEPWPLDACDLAGRYGRENLRLRISRGMRNAEPFHANTRAGAPRRARIRRRLDEWSA